MCADRRILALWLPTLSTDRLERDGRAPSARPRAVVSVLGGRQLLRAVNASAAGLGIRPGQTLADARAMAPDLDAIPADPGADLSARHRIATWCGRYSPWTAPHGHDGVVLDIAGCSHLFGGEAALCSDLLARLTRHGWSGRAAIADTRAAAWAVAKYGGGSTASIVPPGRHAAALAALPVEALDLDAASAGDLRRLGIRRICDLTSLPRLALTTRFGAGLLDRLDRALGIAADPISPLSPVPDHRTTRSFAEPIRMLSQVTAALKGLLADLCAELERCGMGARRLRLLGFRIDGDVAEARIGTSRPVREPERLVRLFDHPLQQMDAGPGIETLCVSAEATEPLVRAQIGFGHMAGAVAAVPAAEPLLDTVEIADLVDRLAARLGPRQVVQLLPRDDHWPDAAVRITPIAAMARTDHGRQDRPHRGLMSGDGSTDTVPPRPLRLFVPPEPVEAMAPVPDDPPILFRWRGQLHVTARAEGPERLLPSWLSLSPTAMWRRTPDIRDYYRVEDAAGRRFWLYRQGLWDPDNRPTWFLHGLFG